MKKNGLLILTLFISNLIVAQENIAFQKPSPAIEALADFKRAPSVSMDSRRETALFTYSPTFRTLDDLNQEELRLGGLRINPVTRIATSMNYITNLKLRKLSAATTEPQQVSGLPANPKIAHISWSPDDKHIAFTQTTSTGVELWVVDVATVSARRLTGEGLNCSLGNPFLWYGDSRRLMVKMIPSGMSALVESSRAIPDGPIVSVSRGEVSQNRTYQDLLKNRIDEQNFETLVTSDLVTVDLGGNNSPYRGKEPVAWMSFSPDGSLLLVTMIEKPYSYVVPYDRFPQKSVVTGLDGRLVKTVNEVPLTEVIPKGFSAVRTGRRNVQWRDDKPASLFFVEALDGGDPAVKVEYRDQLFTWDAPFEGEPVSLARTTLRFGRITWGDDHTAVLNDAWYESRLTQTYLIDPSDPAAAPKMIFSRNSQDVYGDPGRFETRENQYSRRVLAIERGNLFLIGQGYSSEGQFPFIDEYNLKDGTTKRLYQFSEKGVKEDILSITDFIKGIAMVQRQSPVDYPNFYLRNFRKKREPEPLTFFPNPFESIRDVEKEVIRYKRDDGVELSGTLYLPPGYDRKSGEKLPLLIWAYPEEFKDKGSAGQNRLNPNEFTFPGYGSFIYYVVKGYAVLDDASFPIVGEGDDEPNDTFIEQLVANGRAAIDAVDRLGVIDRTRVGVGGHSYGAFMTANLLTHSSDFACGIARSGAYNRTLTPFGFQREARNYWDVPEVYNAMSPFQNAGKMKKPMLLVHGDADNNPGTFTLQTERYFQALKGLGADVRMVLLPKESHGYAARENILHLLWEQEQFLDKYLKK